MQDRWVKLRVGILEHVQDGRMTTDEYVAYTFVILLADFKTGIWRGCAPALAHWTSRSTSWCRRTLASLRRKGYILATPSVGRGQYAIRVAKYHPKKQSVVTASAPEAVTGDCFSAQKQSVVRPYQEVKQEKYKENPSARSSRRSPFPFQPRAKAKRNQNPEGMMDPIRIQGTMNPDYLEFVKLRDEKKIPQGTLWTVWKELSKDQREKIRKAA